MDEMKPMSTRTNEDLGDHLHRLRDILNNYPESGMEEDVYTSTPEFVKDFENELQQLFRDWDDWKLGRTR